DSLHSHRARLERSRRDNPANGRIETGRRDYERCATRNWVIADARKPSPFVFSSIEFSSDMRLVVQKYGGTSVGTPKRIGKVARRLLETQRVGRQVVAVFSAMAGVTDNLLKLAHEVSPHPTKRELDILLSTGEHAATALTAMAVN